MTKAQQSERAESIAQLRKWLQPGDTLYTILRHVSRSGMQREIGLVIMGHRHGESGCSDIHPNYHAARATGSRMGKRDGLIVGGCGMDMGFHIVYNLSYVLFPDGFGIEGERIQEGGKDHRRVTRKRPKTKAEAARMVADGWKFHGRNGDACGWDNDGGYALKHRWL